MKKVLHHHIPKTGGTTLNFLLRESYGEGYGGAKDISPHIGGLKKRGMEPDFPFIFKKFEAIGAHRYLLHVVPKSWVKILILRNPLDRVLSLYYDWLSLTAKDIDSTLRSGPSNLSQNKSLMKDKFSIREMALHEFIQSPLSLSASGNYINGMCKSLINVSPKRYNEDPHELFVAAKKSLKMFDYIALQDNLDGHVKNIFSLLELPTPAVLRLNNREGKLEQIKRLGREAPPIDEDIVKSFQEADYLLYNYAQKNYGF